MLLLIVGAILSSFIIPYVNSQSNHTKLLQETTLKKSIEIVKHNSEINRQLNTILTTIEMFHKDNVSGVSQLENYKEAQEKLRNKINGLYLEFDKYAWWWQWEIYHEAVILELTSSDELQHVDNILKEYESNIAENVKDIYSFLYACLDKEYNPKNTDITNQMLELRNKHTELTADRDKNISKIIRIFASK